MAGIPNFEALVAEITNPDSDLNRPKTDADMLARRPPASREGYLRMIGAHLPNPPPNTLDRSNARTEEERTRIVQEAQAAVAALREGRSLDGDDDSDLSSEPGIDSDGPGLPWQPPEADISPEQIREERSKRAANIFKNFDLLQGILERHEAVIQKRWKKKTKEQKRKIILSAWKHGEMPKVHRPDFVAFKEQDETRGKACPRYQTSFMWPFLNQEDLVKPRTLLMLMNSRGRHPPAEFAVADIEAIHLGIVGHAIQPAFLDEHVMRFTGRKEAATYGELLHWDDHPDAFNWLMNRKHQMPGEGLLILESQDVTMEFLVDCVKAILHDIEGAALLEAAPQPEPPASELETGEAVSWTLLAAEAPYRPPSSLSFARLERLLKAKLDVVEDHIWSMREDPSYFASTVQDAWEHRQDHIKDRRGERHPLFRHGREDLLWGRTIHDVVELAFIQLEYWSEIHRMAAELQWLQEKHAADIKVEEDLPEEYLNAMLSFRSLIDSFKTGTLGQLKVSLMASPPCRHLFVREPHDNPRSIENVTSLRDQFALDQFEFEFFWIFQVLWDDGDKLYQLRFTNVLNELQRKIDSEPQLKKLISPLVASEISDLAIIAECFHQLDTYQPWANMFEDQLIECEEAIEDSHMRFKGPTGKLIDACKGNEDVYARYGSPISNRFYYPIEKRRTRENVEAMREAERDLDTFWHKVDELIHRNGRNLDGTVTRELLTQPKSLQRTPEWVEPIKGAAGKDSKVEVLVKPFSEVSSDLQLRTEQTTDKTSAARRLKSKPKTRGQPAPAKAEDPEPFDASTPKDAQPVFAVDARALKVFRALFHTQSTTSTPGEIKLDDFLWTMTSVNFKSEKLYGSVWQFTPTGLDVEAPSQFHEPHGSMNGKIPFREARRYGRRLDRNYGWDCSMFVLAGKKVRNCTAA